MHVQVLKRYRDRDTKVIHEAGELVEYNNIPRIVTLARGGYVEPLGPLPADAEPEATTNVVTAKLSENDLKILMDRYEKDSANGEHVVTEDDLQNNPDLAPMGGNVGETIQRGPHVTTEGGNADTDTITQVDTPVITHGFVQGVNEQPVVESTQTHGSNVATETDKEPSGKKKGGRPAGGKKAGK